MILQDSFMGIKQIGILGGSFDPPHVGHIKICENAFKEHIDEIIIIPSGNHPLKKNQQLFEHRFQMAELCFGYMDNVTVSDIENRENLSFMRDTLKKVKEEYFQNNKIEDKVLFRLIIGSDILEETKRWVAWDEVEKIAPPLVMNRSEGEVSSTTIREELLKGEIPAKSITKEVFDYIRKFNLYERKKLCKNI
jgi:nicotinate-nucleotide adenylyltransferase